MPLSKIKEEFKQKKISFGKNSDKPIGDRHDIDDLAVIARESGNPNLIRLFETLPELADLKKARLEPQLKRPVPIIQARQRQPLTKKTTDGSENKTTNN